MAILEYWHVLSFPALAALDFMKRGSNRQFQNKICIFSQQILFKRIKLNAVKVKTLGNTYMLIGKNKSIHKLAQKQIDLFLKIP